jgi:hypothetical protein
MMEHSELSSPENTLKQIEISLRFLESKCLSFSLTDYAKDNQIPIELDSYQFELSLNVQISEIQKTLNIIISTSLFQKENENLKHKLASLQSFFVFQIINFEELVLKTEDKKFNVKDPVIDICFGLSLSTTRGMYNIKLENTPYSSAILPIIDIVKLRKGNLGNVNSK